MRLNPEATELPYNRLVTCPGAGLSDHILNQKPTHFNSPPPAGRSGFARSRLEEIGDG
jgi:hypothetical protein